MKKQINSICLLILISISVSAQDWKPFYKGDTVNFKFNNSAIVTNTIWIDSAKIVGSDSVFYLNRVFLNCDTCLHIAGYLNCDTCFALDNQPQFLQRIIIKEENGRYLFSDTANFVLLTNAQLYESWIFDAEHVIIAQVVDISLQNVLGINDSVKIIKLSNNDTIRLSKNHGIIQFPDLYGIGNYLLVGIENRNLGEEVPDFWDIYNFNVGDVFQYIGSNTNGGLNERDEYVKKYDIISKAITSDKLIYYVHHIQKGMKFRLSPPSAGNPYVYNDFQNIEFLLNEPFIYETEKIVNKFNKDLYYTTICGVHADGVVLKFDSLNIITKKIGIITSNNLIYNYVPFNNIPNLFHFTYGSEIDGFANAEYKVSLGRTSIVDGCFEVNRWEFLQGYIKNGDTVGIITSDDILLHLNEDISLTRNNVTLFPNPFTESTTIEIYGKGIYFPCTIDVYDIYGKFILSEKIETEKYIFNKPLKQNEIYLFFIKDALNNIIGKGKMIIQ